jgi:UDP-N-acetyl-D-galactosamine dehydrogenase
MSFSNLHNDIVNRKEKISLIGLGYVGMPIAVSFSRKVDVIGFDVNQAKIDLYKSGIDPTKEVGDEAIATCTVDFTADETRLKEAKFHIVAVPTPVNVDHTPAFFLFLPPHCLKKKGTFVLCALFLILTTHSFSIGRL